MIQIIRYIVSYFWYIKIKTYYSQLNGMLEIWYLKGKLVLNTKHANYSYENQYTVFNRLLRKINLQDKKLNNILLLGFGVGSLAKILRDALHYESIWNE